MAEPYILGVVIATLLGFAVLFFLCKTKKQGNQATKFTAQPNESVNITKEVITQSQPEIAGKVDIVIVGAGVAGAALACTLGKVVSLHFSLALSSTLLLELVLFHYYNVQILFFMILMLFSFLYI